MTRILIGLVLVLGMAQACSIQRQVPEFEYPESETKTDQSWPRLGPTAQLESRSVGQAQALAQRAAQDETQTSRADALAAIEAELNTTGLGPEDLTSRAEALRKRKKNLSTE